MASAKRAAKSISRKLAAACANRLRRWSLKVLRKALDRADEWVHEQEVSLRSEAGGSKLDPEYDRVASAARERKMRAARPRLARLKYQHGEFVRQA